MIIKRYLPFRFSREGYIPDRIYLQFFEGTVEDCEKHLSDRNKTAHYYLSEDGTVTVLTPVSGAANLLGPLGDPQGLQGSVSPARRGILILIEGNGSSLSEPQREPLIRLLKGIQKEVLRIYGERFNFCRDTVICDKEIPLEDLLDRGLFQGEEKTLFRVQTGSYRNRRDAEDSVERLQRAGIAAYITEVKYS